MSYQQPDTSRLVARAGARWAALEAERPELAASIGVQRRLVLRTLGALDALLAREEALPVFPAPYVRTKLDRGIPLLRGETIPPVVEVLGPLLRDFADIIADGGAGDPARHVRETFDRGAIDAASWLTTSLARDRKRIRDGATQMALAPDLLWLIGELAAAPLAHLIGARTLEDNPAVADTWSRGLCPVCGSWPALAEQASGRHRYLCAFCGWSWSREPERCTYCDDRDHLTTSTPVPDRPEHALQCCGACAGYLKTVVASERLVFPLATIEDLATSDIDVTALETGFRRPDLPDEDASPSVG